VTDQTLNTKQAYVAMYSFLANAFERGWRDLGGLLGSLSLLEDGEPADPALWMDWEAAVQAGLNPDTDIRQVLTKK
jgi:hypothetical protein